MIVAGVWLLQLLLDVTVRTTDPDAPVWNAIASPVVADVIELAGTYSAAHGVALVRSEFQTRDRRLIGRVWVLGAEGVVVVDSDDPFCSSVIWRGVPR